ncbi:hypothetical protein [Streptomyces xylophagus]|uniref:hypothetical protein n=1 Tax=Streptomyces xylophagus TaxID=285514 RepID=UPI000B0BF4A5|nr:hypothetical protein [Streptomyces xylophagus]
MGLTEAASGERRAASGERRAASGERRAARGRWRAASGWAACRVRVPGAVCEGLLPPVKISDAFPTTFDDR